LWTAKKQLEILEGVRIGTSGTIETTGTFWTEPRSLDRFCGEFRMPRGEKKGVTDERAEEVFGGIQA
jgi:hypothetical protein